MRFYLISILILSHGIVFSQEYEEINVQIDGEIVEAIVTNGDTMLLYDLDEVQVTEMRCFNTPESRKLYYKYRRYAKDVYPYANEAIRILRETLEETEDMSRRQERKYLRQKNKELKSEFQDQLKQLSKTQGYVLVKMIEKELNSPMYELIRHMRSGISARYWHTMGSSFGYDLKQGYVRGDDEMLDLVLDDFELIEKINASKKLKASNE